MGVTVGAARARRGTRASGPRGTFGAVRRVAKPALSALAVLLAAAAVAGAVFSGSRERIPVGVTIAGADVGGLTASEAEAVLRRRAAELRSVPVVFVAGGRRWEIVPGDLRVRPDWKAAVARALALADGPPLWRGLERLKIRLLGADVRPRADVYESALEFRAREMARAVDRPARDAAIVLRGLRPVVVPSSDGRELDRDAAARTLVAGLVGLERRPVALPVAVDRPRVTTDDLAPVAGQVRVALSAPVRLGYRSTHWLIHPAELAALLELPAGGRSELRVGGAKAKAYFARLARGVDRKPRDADLAVTADGRVRVVPARRGRRLDARATAASLLAGALSPTRREAQLAVVPVEPQVTTREARALGITRVLASYATPYAGTADRIRNLELAVSLLDGAVVRRGATFSFNAVVGQRTAERGFRPAPVIIGNEYAEGIGGGVSQVATTVFNAAWEAGLKITARTAHALYISRYPLGRDATVSYPEIDLRFVNDTEGPLVVDAFSGEAGITVRLLGVPTARRVVSEAGPLVVAAPPEIEKILDPTLLAGEQVVVDDGEPARRVTVTRTVYEDGRVLYDETWTTTYRSQPRVVRVGTLQPPPEVAPKPEEETPPKKKKDEETSEDAA